MERKNTTIENKSESRFSDDSDGLEYHLDTGMACAVGQVEEVNGEGAALARNFVPTRFELELLAKHWLSTYFDTNYYCYVVNQSGSTEYRLILYSQRRLQRLRAVLGEERYSQVCAVVDLEFEKRFGGEEWRAFRKPKT